MSSFDKIDFEIKGIGDFISDKFLSVPFYQRSFAWEEKQIDELFQDITSIQKTFDYFLGSIVIIRNHNSTYEIVDGQQRIATMSILFAAIRNWYSDNKFNNLANEICNTFLSKFDRNTEDTKPRLSLNGIDNNFFKNIVINRQKDKPIRESNKRIEIALNKAKSIIEKLLFPYSKISDKKEELKTWTTFFQNQIKIVIVTAPGHSDAYTIFETLNDRGKALATTDLIKNYLFQKSSDSRLNEARDLWSKMTGIIENSISEEEIENFIRYYWSSIKKFTRSKELFKAIKNDIIDENSSISLLSNLNINSERYSAIMNYNHYYWEDYGDTTKDYIRILNTLKLTQYRPLMLSVLNKFDKNETKKCLKLLVSWSARNLITGNLGGGTMEKIYSEKAIKINNGEIKNVNELKKDLKEFIPNDSEFKNSFKTATVNKAYLARYYLRALENQKKGEGTPEVVPNENIEVLNLEHILPQNPNNLGNDWQNFNEEEHDAYNKRIGNLALLKNKINSDVANGSFSNKKQFYKDSDLMLTKSLASYEIWSIENIEKRQNELADLAVKAWSL